MAYTTINKSTDYFNTKLYSGTGSSQGITGVGFQPDFIWIKQRSGTQEHWLVDAVRGTTKFLESNATNAESSDGATGFTSFDSDGFTVNTSARTNQSSNTYASWNWKAGGTGSANTDGSISSTVSVNTTAGCSIVSYTGTGANATVGHGLGSAPKVIIVKGRSFADSWGVYHHSIGNGKNLKLNSTNAQSTSSTHWQDTDPTSSVFSIGTNTEINTNSATFIAYCFAEKTGYSKFGSYTGNGSTDGTFVYTGFKPAWVMWKKSDATEDWGISDNKRDTFNVMNNKLRPNSNIAEVGSQVHVDYLSNGFKWRSASGEFNTSGGSYIYMAFGQSIVGSNNIPATAR